MLEAVGNRCQFQSLSVLFVCVFLKFEGVNHFVDVLKNVKNVITL